MIEYGLRGAGLTNSFWLKAGAVVLQLVPYGWELQPGQLMRSVFSADLGPAIGGHYRQVSGAHRPDLHNLSDDVQAH